MIKWLFAGGGALATALIAYGLHSFDVNRIEANHAKALKAQAVALNDQCEKQKAITEKVSNDYQNKISDLNRRIADARRLHGHNACIAIKSNTSGRHDATASGGVASGQGAGGYSIDINQYIDFASEGEKYRIQLLACQDFVRLTEPPKKGQKQPK